MVSAYFAQWMAMQSHPTILPNQTYSIVNTIDRLDTSDVISILFYGSEKVAVMALYELKRRFEWEMNELDEIEKQRQEQENDYCWH